jgi:hypothetical protein
LVEIVDVLVFGLTRSSSDENRINIEERIALARRTLYSLIKTGVHGTNGLNPRTSCKIYQVYVIPRLLYGLETLNLKKKDMATLSSFHIGTLKRLQSLPIRTANSVAISSAQVGQPAYVLPIEIPML